MIEWFALDDFTFMTDAVSTWLAYGIGFGAIFWIIGLVVALIFSFVRY